MGCIHNKIQTKTEKPFGEMLNCQMISKGVFGAGAAFIFFQWILGLLYYILFAKSLEDWRPAVQHQVGMTAFPQASPYAL